MSAPDKAKYSEEISVISEAHLERQQAVNWRLIPNRESREIIFSVIAVVAIVLFGTMGYMWFEGWNWFDSLYMTVITLATIGYGEVHPMDSDGRAFTIVLIFVGVGVASVVLSLLTKKLLDRHVSWPFDRRKMQERINQLSGHTIFCGYGRLSRIAAGQVHAAGEKVVVVERDEARLEQARQAGLMVVQGDATHDETLREAGIARACRLVTLLPKDSDNLYVVLTSRELNEKIHIISRSEEEPSEKRLLRAGANRVVTPYRAGAQKIAYGILRPAVAQLIDLAESAQGTGLQMEEIRIPESSPVNHMTLQQSELRQRTNVIVAAVISPKGDMHFNPSGETLLESGATLIGLGFKRDFLELERLLVGG